MKKTIYVLSDSVGETAERVVRAALSQFGDDDVEVSRIPYITNSEVLAQVLDDAREDAAVIAYTLVVPELAAELEQKAEKMGITTIDILGDVMKALADLTGRKPKYEPGLIHKMDEEYFREVEAIEFAVKYDDGKDTRGVLRADLVLIGVSRTSKTPLSMYLAHKRLRVANVPLVPEVEAPEELFIVDPQKIIGLTISPEVLSEIRAERLKALGLGSNASYADMSRILRELEYAEGIMKKIGCPVIDVTHKAVEETASLVMEILNGRNRSAHK